jgi:hypothetical protein
MAPFTHVSPDRPSRFSAGAFGVLYVADRFEVALSETLHHHALFMAATAQAPGWTSQFREIVLDVGARCTTCAATIRPWVRRSIPTTTGPARPWAPSCAPPVRRAWSIPASAIPGGQCVGLFYPDLAANAVQGRHLDYHWDGDAGGPDPRAGDGEGVSGAWSSSVDGLRMEGPSPL